MNWAGLTITCISDPQVSSFNFSPFYRSREGDQAVTLDHRITNTITFTCAEDIASGQPGPIEEVNKRLPTVCGTPVNGHPWVKNYDIMQGHFSRPRLTISLYTFNPWHRDSYRLDKMIGASGVHYRGALLYSCHRPKKLINACTCVQSNTGAAITGELH